VPFDNLSSDKHSLSLTTAPVVARLLHSIEKGKFTARQVENVRNHKQFGPILARLQVHFNRTWTRHMFDLNVPTIVVTNYSLPCEAVSVSCC
jgi:hypothetical protein